MNSELDIFAQGIYDAYSSFRIAGFEEVKAFALTTSFMISLMNKQLNDAVAQEAKKGKDGSGQ